MSSHNGSTSVFSDLKGKVALITGGTSGIGRATAIALAQNGAHVVVTGRREAEGKAVADEVRKMGVQGVFIKGDVTDEAHVKSAVAEAKKLTGRLDLAFNNAGVELGNVNTTDGTVEQYRKVMDINVLGVLLSMKHEISAMLAQGPGKDGVNGAIVNNASIAGTVGMAGVGLYIASKHAVLGLTKSAALETAKAGIRVNAVSPGGIETEMFDRFTGGSTDAKAWMASMHPVGRMGHADEIAKPVLFLLSNASSFVTGHDLKVDGGFTVG